ncbi:HD domain-containing phosphohydrolase [Longimicrobium sp.]|uniref:HD domain-containing phosphohydrolase n=1 Tax=Longimicrobium sp. TaxID=2029185 RepID=UPI002C86685F|nr:HD domain-containing phosphohydrolase [Longimicrobium sp.]HSU13953.1 HD domain-containing phosphohydrolase [Longimicrobium sp.]
MAASLLRWIARTHLDGGTIEVAGEIAETALAVSQLAGDLAGEAHANNLLGLIERERGDLERAESLHSLARDLARAADLPPVVAMAETNLGIVANIRGEYRTALKRYRASLAVHRTLGTNPSLPHALNNLAMLFTDLRRWRAADRAFAEALRVCDELGDAAGRAKIEGNRIEVLIAQKRWAEARMACTRARRLAVSTGETATLAEVSKHLGVIARETGDWGAAARNLGRAARIADERGDLLLGAETAREQARLHWTRHQHRETLQALNRAHGLFSRLQARRDLAEVDGQLGELESTFVNIVAAWGQSIESADHYTRGHCERVASYACALATAAGLDPDVLLWFRMGALLHDVGKIVVPPEILNKPGKLTPDERAVIERHPDAGVELIGDIEFPWDIRPMVRHHHEAWDGSGYPAGLAGDSIPLPARILCVADVYDALASDRPYRRGFPHERTLSIMAAEAGTRLDPRLFELFTRLELPVAAQQMAA